MKIIKKCYNIRMIGIHRLKLAENAIGSSIKNNNHIKKCNHKNDNIKKYNHKKKSLNICPIF